MWKGYLGHLGINLEIEAREKVVVHEEKSESDRMFSGLALFSASNQNNI